MWVEIASSLIICDKPIFQILHMEAEKVHGMANRGKDEKIEQLELDLGQGKLEIQQLRNKYAIRLCFSSSAGCTKGSAV